MSRLGPLVLLLLAAPLVACGPLDKAFTPPPGPTQSTASGGTSPSTPSGGTSREVTQTAYPPVFGEYSTEADLPSPTPRPDGASPSKLGPYVRRSAGPLRLDLPEFLRPGTVSAPDNYTVFTATPQRFGIHGPLSLGFATDRLEEPLLRRAKRVLTTPLKAIEGLELRTVERLELKNSAAFEESVLLVAYYQKSSMSLCVAVFYGRVDGSVRSFSASITPPSGRKRDETHAGMIDNLLPALVVALAGASTSGS